MSSLRNARRPVVTVVIAALIGALSVVVSSAQAAQAASNACTPDAGYETCVAVTYAGNDQTFTVPANVSSVLIKAWGAGGGGVDSTYYPVQAGGGAGGYATGNLAVTPGQNLTVVVGQGGRVGTSTGGSTTATYGGGGAGGVQGAAVSNLQAGSSGGGLSGVFVGAATQANAGIVAGGGGGSSPGSDTNTPYAGGGGGATGGQDTQPIISGRGGSQTAGGAAATANNGCVANAVAGSALTGGAGSSVAAKIAGSTNYEGGGGGGGGYFGGGGGKCQNANANAGSALYNGDGGGGSSYIGAAGLTNENTIAGGNSANGNPGTGGTAPNTGDSKYVAGVATGGAVSNTASNIGGNGLVVLEYKSDANTGKFTCQNNSIYGVHGTTTTDFSVTRINTTTGVESLIGTINADAGTNLNGLAIVNGGATAYAINRNVTSNGATTIYAFDPTTNTSTKFAGPTVALAGTATTAAIVEGAVDPVSGIYYFAYIDANGFEIYGFNTNTNTPITGRIAHISGITGGNGDFAFDRQGRLVLTASSGDGTNSANPLLYASQPLPTTGTDAAVTVKTISYLAPNDSTFNGLAFDLPEGYLYVNSLTAGQSTIRQIDPTSGAEVSNHPITYLGNPVAQISDLGSCTYNNSIQVQKNIVSRTNAADQFTVTLSSSELATSLTGTTSGTSVGLQTNSTATAGPSPALSGKQFTFTETPGNTGTSLASYNTTWTCQNTFTGATLFTGTGTTGTITFPPATDANGIPLNCVFRNESINSSIAISKTADKTAYRAGQTVTYTIKVTNTGNSTLSNVAITDQSNASCAQTLTGTLAPNDVRTYTCTATAPVPNNSNTAVVTAKDPVNTTVTATSTVPVPVINPSLQLTKSASPTTVTTLGQQITYTFSVKNTGDTAVSNLSIADSPVAPGGVPATISCQATTLAAGATTTCTGTYAATQADLNNGSIKDNAVANGTDPVGGAVASNTSSATVNVTQTPALTLTKTATPTTISSVGATVSYAFTVTNTGNVTVTGVTVGDVFDNASVAPPAITCPTTTLVPGAAVRCTATYTSTQSDFDQGTINNTATATAKDPNNATVTSPTSSASVTATVAPSLSLIKSANPTTITAANQTVTYSFKVTNTGNQTLNSVSIADTFTAPAGPALSPITCPATTLAPGATTTCTATYTSTQADVDNGSIKNSAVANAKNAKGVAVASAQSNATVTVPQAPALTVVKTASPTTITAAGAANKVTYTFKVTNTGNTTVKNVAIADTFASPAGPALNPITCDVTTLAPGAVATCTATYTPTQADVNNGNIKNSATATGVDPNNAPVTSGVSNATVTVTRNSALSLTKSASPTTVTTVGQTVTYTFVVTNTGNQSVTGVSISDVLTTPANPPLTITCDKTALDPAGVATCTATYKATQADLDNGTINNSATATAKDQTNATVTSNTSTATVAASTTSALTVVKSASPATYNAVGQTINYSFLVTNTGSTTVSAIAIVDPKFTGAAAAVCPNTTLAPGGTVTCTASYKTVQADLDSGKIVNTANATGTGPKGAPVSSPSSTATVNANQTSTLSLIKSAAPASVKNAGDKITYSFLVTNTGNTTITGLTINDTFTAPAAPVPAITCPVTTLAPNQSTTCTSAQYTVTQADVNSGAINNSANATGKNPANTTITSNNSTASVPAAATTGLTLQKTVNPTTITTAGQTVTYTFAVTNSSNVTVNGLTIADAFTAPGGPLVNAITCAATTLAPNANTNCTVTYTATQADVDAGSIKNSASASAKDPSGNTVTSNTSSATVTIPASSSLTVTKTANPTTVSAAGQTVTYTFVVTNTGNTTLTGAGVVDTFTAPAGPNFTPNCPTTAILPTKSITCTGTYTVKQADIDNGSIKNSASATAKDPSGATIASPTVNATVTVPQTNALSVVKAASPTSVTAAGQVINYTFTVSNTGNTTLSLLTIIDTLTAPASPTPTVSCPSTVVGPNSQVVCSASYTVTQADIDNGTIGNSAVARASTPGGATITSPPSTSTVSVASNSALQLTKSASPASVSSVGQTVTYTFTVKNTGSVTIKGIAISDTFTAPAGPALNPITCNATSLAPGISTTCSASYSTTQADLDAGTINNSATATGTNPTNTAVTSNTSTATVATAAAPSLSLTKTANPTSITAVGQTVTYTFAVKNTGNVAVNGVTINDSKLTTAPTCTPANIAPNATATCTGTYTATQADVDAGSFTNNATASGTAAGGATVTSPNASATVTVPATPTLTITKTANPTTVAAGTALGSTVTYTFGVKNTGNVTVKGVNVVDRFTAPAGPPLAPITCGSTTLAPNATTTCTATYTVTQADIDKGSIANSATAAGLDPNNGAVGSAPATANVTITQTSTLTLTKTANPTTATKAGQKITYGFAVKNTGNTTLTGLAISDTFTAPAGPALQPINCDATTLAPGATTNCTASYTVTQADVDTGSIKNGANATASNPAGTKITSNTSNATVTIGAGPALALTKTASPTTYSAVGQTISYTFVVTNTGTVTIGGISIADPMFQGNAAPACAATSLAPNTSTTCTATYTTTQVDLDRGQIVNNATATGSAPNGTGVASPTATATATATQSPALKLIKSASPQTITAIGDPVSYSFRVSNTGNVTLTNINVTDVFQAPASSGLAVDCPDLTLAPGQFTICTLSYPSKAADFANGQINNTGVAHGTPPTGPAVDSNPSSATVTATQTTGLTVVKSASPTSVATVGQTVTYSFAVKNNGTVPLTNITVVDTFAAPAGPEITPTCGVTTLAAGASTTCTATYKVTQADLDNGSINNSAVVNGTPQGGGATVTSPPSTATVDASATGSLSLTKSANPTTVTAVGQAVTYTFVVTNNGATTVTNVGIADPLLTGANAPVCAGATGGTGPSLAPGKTVTCTATYTTTQADLDRGRIVNTATATGTDPRGNALSSPTATATVTATQNPKISVVKTATTTGPIAKVGDKISYSIVATNTGNVTFNIVTVNDALASPASPALTLNCPANTVVAPGGTYTCTATYTATQADLDNGTVNNTATASGTTPAGATGTGTTVTSDPSTTSTTTAAPSALTLVKTVSVTSATVGQQVTYNFAVTNSGNTTISGLVINDTFTAPATPVPTIRCAVTTLAPGATTNCTGNYTVKQADADKGRVDNSATASGKNAAGTTVTSAPSTATFTVPQSSSLSLVKSAAPTTVSTVGQTVTYTFKVTNTGTTTITGVAVADTFAAPAGPALTITCPTDPLAPGVSVNCTATYKVTQADVDNGAINNSATVSGQNPAGTTVTSQQSTASVAVTQSSGLSVVKSASPTTVSAAGQTVNYSFLVTNNGSVTLKNIAITDTMQPPASTLAAAPVCPVTTLAPGASTTCTASYVATQADIDNGAIRNSATVSGTDPQNKSVTSDPSVAVVTANKVTSLTLTKAAVPTVITGAGQAVKYTFTLTNKGNVTLTNPTVADTFTAPAGPPLGPITCDVTSIAPNGVATCTATYTSTQNDVDAGSIVNSATAAAKDPAGNSVASNTSTATVGVSQSQTLALVKSVSPTSVTAAGQVVRYSFQVTNNGNVTVSSLSIADTFTAPAGPALVITCDSTTVAPGKTVTCSGNYTVTQDDVNKGSVNNSAIASGKNPAGNAVTSPASTATVTIPKTSSLSVVKSANVSTVSIVGRAVTYSFKVTNTGNQTLSGIAVADTFTAPAGPEITPTCPVTTLQPGESTTCTASYTVTSADVDNGSIKNSATAKGTDPSGASITSAPSTYTIAVTQSTGLQLVKTATVTDVNGNNRTDLGDTIAYTFAVTNTGNRALNGLSITDATAGPITCDTVTLAAGATTNCRATTPHTVTQADVDNGSVTNTATATAKDSAGNTVTSPPSTATTTVAGSSSLSLVKSASPAIITAAGQTVTYSFAVTNNGTTTISNLVVADTLAAPAAPQPTVTCPTAPLAPGKTATCTATYVSTQADVNNGSITNAATVSGTDPTGATVTSPGSTATVAVNSNPALKVVKSASPTTLTAAGQSVTYTFTVTNTGNVTASNLVVTDTFTTPAASTATPVCDTQTLAPGATTSCTLTYVATQADVDAGSIKNSAVASATGPGGTAITSPPSAVTVGIAPNPSLTLAKSATPATVSTVGQTVTYSFAVKNTGNVTISGLAIADTFTAPAGPPLANITCQDTTLAPNATTTCTATYTVTQADLDQGVINNRATVSGTTPAGGKVTSPQSTATVPATDTPTLTLVKTANPTTVTAAGQTVTYTFTVKNTGNVTITNVAIADTLTAPAGPALTITCPTTPLAPNGTAVCTAPYTVTQADINNGSIKNTATASGLDPTGKTAASLPSSATVSVAQAPALTVKKSASPTAVSKVGDTIAYSFLVTNTGNTTVTGISIADTFTAPAGPVPAITCPKSTLNPGDTTLCSASYTVTQNDIDAGTVVNSATVSGSTPGGGTVTSDPSTATVSTTPSGGLTVTKTSTPKTFAAVGDKITYTFVVTNTGNVTATNVGVTDTFSAPAGVTVGVTCPTTTLAPNASTTCTGTYTATQADVDRGTLTNAATATGTTPGGGSTTSPPATLTVTAAPAPALTVQKSATPATIAAVGDVISYSFLVTNTGNVTLGAVAINDTLASPAGPEIKATCPAGSLLPGAQTTCTASYTVTQADLDNGSVNNSATASGTDPKGNIATSRPSTATVPVNRTGALTLVKSASPTSVTAAGDKVTYSFVVTNNSNVTLTNISVADTLTAPAGPEVTVTCPTTPLAAGKSVTCTASYTATQADIDNGTINNSAKATGTDPGGKPVTSQPSTATVTTTPTTALTLVKTASTNTVAAVGDVITYTFAVTNNGTSTVSGLRINDTFTAPAAPALVITCPTASVAPKTTVRCTGSYTVTQADLDNGSVKNSATATGTSAGGAPVTSNPSTATVGTSTTAKLTVTKTASPTTVTRAGAQITYTFKVTNTGTTTVSGIAIVDTFTAPAGPSGPITCNDSQLLPNTSTTCTTVYAATQQDVDAGIIRNTAYATGTDTTGATVNSPNASATVTIPSTGTLTVAKTASPTTVSAAGDKVTYSFKVTNTGNVTVSGIAIDDAFATPAGPPVTATCPQPTLAPGANETCTATYTATQADIDNGSISNTATATGKTPTGGTVTSPPSTATVTAAPAGALTIVKSASPTAVTTVGQSVTYTFVVTNTGNVTVNGVTIADTLTAPAAPALRISPASASVAPGKSATFTATYKVTQADLDNGSVDNTATASGKDPLGATVNSGESTATVSVTQSPSLTLVKSASPKTVTAAGQVVKYSFAVTNNGNTTVDNLTINDTLAAPAGPALVITCPVTSLAPKATTTCTASYTVTQDDVNSGGIANTATASGTDPAGNPVTSPPSSVTTSAPANPSLALVKKANPTTINPVTGSTVSYTFAVTNNGNVTVTNLAINDTLAAPAGPALTITCPVTKLDPLATTTCTATYTVTQADIDAGTISNSAQATGTAPGTTPPGSPVTSPTSTATVAVTQTTGLTLVKSADRTSITAAGQVVTYTFTATNTGDVTLRNLAVADTLTAPAGPALTVTCPTTPLLPNTSTTCTASYTVTQKDVDNGSVKNTATASATNPQGGLIGSTPSTVTVPVNAPSSLTVVKSANPTTVSTAGQTVTYSFLVTNTGNVTVGALKISDPKLTGANAATCPVSSLAPGANTTCTATYTVTQADVDNGTIVNTASATGTTPGGTPVTSDPSTATVTAAAAPGLTVKKSASPSTVANPGDTVTYTVLVTNTGNVTLTGITVADVLTAPAGPAITLTCTGTNTGPGTISSLAPGKSSTCTGTYKTTAADFDNGSITNTATASGTPPNSTTPVTSDPSPVTVSAPAKPALTITKTATPHDLNGDRVTDLKDTITYTFTVKNTGNVTITGVGVTDQLAGPVTCAVTTLAAGASTTCKADTDYVVTQADVDRGKVDNIATVTGTPVTGGGPITPVSSNPVSTPIGAKPGLTLVKKGALVDTNGDGRTDAGDQVTWTFLVTNTGNVTITDLVVTDPAAGTVTCPVTTLLPGVSTTCKADKPLTLKVSDLDNGSVTNTASVGGTDPTGTSVTSPPSTATVPLAGSPSLTLSKTARVTDTNDDGVTDAGDTVVWSFLITNTGNVTVNDIKVVDPTAGVITCPKTSLAPGESMTCTSGSHTITAAENNAGKLSNTATVTGTPNGTGGLTVTSPPSTATVNTHGSSGVVTPPNTGGNNNGGSSPVANTGAQDLGLLLGISLVSLLLGVMLSIAGLRRRRQDGLA